MSVSYDAEIGDWNTKRPIGSLAFANCSCGSTLALGTENMELSLRMELLNWVKLETNRRSISPSELLEELRDKIRKRALGCQTPKHHQK